MATIAIKILEILEQQFEPDKAKAIAKSIEQALEENNSNLHNTLATKEDILLVREDLSKHEASTKEDLAKHEASTKEALFLLREDLSKHKASTKEDIAKLEAKLEVRIAQTEVRILRWLVTLWITQMVAILALFFNK